MPSHCINTSEHHLKEQFIALHNIDFMDFVTTWSEVIGCQQITFTHICTLITTQVLVMARHQPHAL